MSEPESESESESHVETYTVGIPSPCVCPSVTGRMFSFQCHGCRGRHTQVQSTRGKQYECIEAALSRLVTSLGPNQGPVLMKVDELLQVGTVQTITLFGLCVVRGREETLRGSRSGRHSKTYVLGLPCNAKS